MSKNLDEYLNCDDYLGHPVGEDGFTKFFNEAGKEYYFAYIEDGKVILKSEGYSSESGRDNGIESVKKNEPIEGRYKLVDLENGKWRLSLKAGNHQEIAVTCSADSEDAAWAYLPSKRAEAKAAALAAAAQSTKVLDEYLSCDAYKGHDRSEKYPDFSTFGHEGEFYFAMLSTDGDVVLRSEGYKAEKGRENGIQSVLKNREIENRYKVLEEDGQYFASLKAGNHQEIGRSCPYDSEAAALASTTAWKAVTGASSSTKVLDEYLSCDAYKGHDRSAKYADFSTFGHEGEFYFAMLSTDGDVVLRSEGYKAEKGRENGIQSVIKNRDIDGRYKILEENGQYFASLKAGNHQEIGRSCAYDSEAAALASTTAWKPVPLAAEPPKSNAKDDDYLKCEEYKGHMRGISNPEFSTFEKDGLHYFAMLNGDDEVLLRSEGYTTIAARNNGIRSVIKNRDIEKRTSVVERFGHYFVILKAGNHQEIARSCAIKDEASAMGLLAAAPLVAAAVIPDTPEVPAEPAEPADKEDDYLACKEYEGHNVNDKINNVAFFKNSGQYYFVLYKKDGSVKLRSEGFHTPKERDQELSGVVRFHDNPDMYEKIQKGKYFMDVLKDETGREVGRSCLQKEETVIVPPVVPVIPPTPEPEPVDKEDDYLACSEYENRHVNDKVNNVTLFKFSDDQYYFALYDGDGNVKLRSEGFRTSKERDQELSGVLRFHDNPNMYERIQKGKYYMDVLKDETGREVGRSCLQKEVAAVIPPVVPVAVPIAPIAAVTAGAAAIITSDPDPEPVVVPPVAAAAPVVAAGGSGCMANWWKWLLALLLLLLLLWLFKGCLGCGGDAAVAPIGEVETKPKTETTVETPAVANEADAAAIAAAAAAKAAADAEAAANAAKAAAAVKPKYDLESIYYDYNKYDLRSASMSELDEMVTILNSDETLQGEFLGHTDTRGSQEYNERLSRKRAQAALNYVASKGIDKSRLSWRNYSEDNPKAKNDLESEAKLQLNRRVDLRILRNGSVVEDTEKDVNSVN